MKRSRRQTPEGQGDLFTFTQELFPVRRPVETVRPVDLSLRIKAAMGEALRENGESIDVLAARMTQMTGQQISGHTLYTYTAPSKPDRQIHLIEFVAFVRATGAFWLWDLLVEDDGLTVLQGAEAKLAQLGHLRQQHRQLEGQLRVLERELRDHPVTVTRRHGGEK